MGFSLLGVIELTPAELKGAFVSEVIFDKKEQLDKIKSAPVTHILILAYMVK